MVVVVVVPVVVAVVVVTSVVVGSAITVRAALDSVVVGDPEKSIKYIELLIYFSLIF